MARASPPLGGARGADHGNGLRFAHAQDARCTGTPAARRPIYSADLLSSRASGGPRTHTAIWLRFGRSSLSRMCWTWFCAVRSDTNSRDAISRFVRPCGDQVRDLELPAGQRHGGCRIDPVEQVPRLGPDRRHPQLVGPPQRLERPRSGRGRGPPAPSVGPGPRRARTPPRRGSPPHRSLYRPSPLARGRRSHRRRARGVRPPGRDAARPGPPYAIA